MLFDPVFTKRVQLMMSITFAFPKIVAVLHVCDAVVVFIVASLNAEPAEAFFKKPVDIFDSFTRIVCITAMLLLVYVKTRSIS